jgi:predicted amidophosphoribosyltransferase
MRTNKYHSSLSAFLIAISLILRFNLDRFENGHMTECKSCGASVLAGVRECPYCGFSFINHATDPIPETRDPRVYTIDKEGTTIRFGDGERGTRLPTGKDNVSASYRYGGGSSGNLVCSNCKHKNPETRTDCEACGTPLKKPVSRLRR